MSSPLIEVRGLQKSYNGSMVLNGVSFTIMEGETLGLFGISGSGKTTLGRCMVLLDRPEQGEILYQRRDLLKMNSKEFSRLRPKLQMIFQHPESSLNPRIKSFKASLSRYRYIKI